MFFRTVFVSFVLAVSLSAAMPADANLFKDLKKALEDVEKKLAPSTENEQKTAPGTSDKPSGGSAQSSGGSSSAVSASQPDDFGDGDSFIRTICEPLPTSSIYK